MLKKNIFFIPIFLLSLFFLSSCANFQPITFTGVDSVNILEMNKDGISTEISVRIKNPNATAFTVYNADVDVQLNGTFLGTAHLTEKVKIPANAEETEIVKVKTNFSKISLKDIFSFLPVFGGSNAIITLKGTIKAGKIFYKKTFPITISTPVNTNIHFTH
ncbi:MAG TPA: LEA type 2 family protein [Bacteroidia bacterium]|nr:LEA type 2 family protein [Bacteroidia bacterium]